MTKLAHVHFTTNAQAENRILAMGEEAWRVRNAGFPIVDLIAQGEFATPEQLGERFDIDPDRPLVVFTQHSVTTEFEKSEFQIEQSLQALDRLAEEDIQILMTYPNNDVGGRTMYEALEQFAASGRKNVHLHRSLGRYNYHGALALAAAPERRAACVGNSSSGIKETPAFGCPTVNIGSRQQSRLRGSNVIDVNYEPEAIFQATRKCLFDESFRRDCRSTENPYGKGRAGEQIADFLATMTLDSEVVLRKKMVLRGETNHGWFR